MTNYGPDSVTINIDDSGGTPQDLSADITAINGIEVSAIMNKTTGFGSSWITSKPSGVRGAADVTIEGVRDDRASGPEAVLSGVATGPSATTRTLSIAYGGRTESCECWIKSYTPVPSQESIQMFKATLEVTGAVTVT